ncbi:AraC family transcriptional regulator [Dyadobacter sp. CY261]|uniref:AraC family transcriptional regulator n=1 Tax=Dyadobacter sp. CY261 TaxID=2907203 RepID=UPI001F1C08D1|nr:AraC family transcriptional regulator [Dyadobacter sp. CY261]MCF0069387.1 AraC family transcriptional regulator [Dyadobacter sp. CY261]
MIAETQQTSSAGLITIAVLPFVNPNNDPEEEFFSDGVTDDIINLLSRVRGLQVAGRISSFTFKGTDPTPQFAGERLHVSYILRGTLQTWGDKLRLATELVEVADGRVIWTGQYDRDLDDIFDVQEEVALAIINAVRAQLLGEQPATTFKRYTHNNEAYQLYLRGLFYHNKFGGADEYHKAIAYFESAIELDPAYAIAYAGIASCYLNMWFYRHLPAETALPFVKQFTERALDLDSEIAESYLALARMQMLYEWDFKSAARSFEKALALNWNTADLHCQYGLFLAFTGDTAKAREETALALSLEPFSLINNFYAAYVYWVAGDFENAVAQGRKLVELQPAFWGGHMIIGLNLITLKDFPEAQDTLEAALEINYNGITLSACGVLFGLSGEIESAKDIITQMNTLHKTQVVSNYDMGVVHASIGEADVAVEYFQKAIDRHEPPMLFFKYIVRDWLSGERYDERYKAYAGLTGA